MVKIASKKKPQFESDPKTLNKVRDILDYYETNNDPDIFPFNLTVPFMEKTNFLKIDQIDKIELDNNVHLTLFGRSLENLDQIIEQSQDPGLYEKAFEELIGFNIIVIKGDELTLYGENIKEYTSLLGIIRHEGLSDEELNKMAEYVYTSSMYMYSELDDKSFDVITNQTLRN